MKIHEFVAAETAFVLLKQKPDESPAEYKKRFDIAIIERRALGVVDMEEQEIAMRFLSNLDMKQYGQMFTTMKR